MSIEQLKREVEIGRVAENTKMAVVGVLTASVAAFAVVGKESVRQIIWSWAGFMLLLVTICAVQDLMVRRRIKASRTRYESKEVI